MAGEEIKLTEIEFDNQLCGEDKVFRELMNVPIAHGRWDVTYRRIFQRLSDGKYFENYDTVGATESQDSGYDGDVELTEVKLVIRTVMDFETVKG